MCQLLLSWFSGPAMERLLGCLQLPAVALGSCKAGCRPVSITGLVICCL
jgi:hypothetical protein